MKMTQNLMHTSSEKSACRPRSECQQVKLQNAIHSQKARAQNRFHRGHFRPVWTNLFRFLLQVETQMAFDLWVQCNAHCVLLLLSSVRFGTLRCNSRPGDNYRTSDFDRLNHNIRTRRHLPLSFWGRQQWTFCRLSALIAAEAYVSHKEDRAALAESKFWVAQKCQNLTLSEIILRIYS